jgi:DNA-binding CsgD family transcriptional regulator/tetratricopeptide (TPR) repeat protein
MEMLLERENEVARLHSVLDEARDGRGRIVFVGGEAGIGKTSLVGAFAVATAGDPRMVIGRCDALVTPRTLGPLLDLATGLGLSADHGRDALMGDLLDHVRRHGTTILVIEDAHWADEASIDLLVMLGRRVADLPLMLIVTYRDDEVGGEHPLRRAIGDLVTSSSTIWLGLAPLSRHAVDVLAERHGVTGESLYERTGGNPFFVTEALAGPDQDVPTSVRLAVLARAARLDPSARSVLDAVSVVPGQAEAWLVEALSDQPGDAIDACVAAGVIVADRGMCAFRHELARLAIEADLTDGARRDFHQRAVEVLSARGDIDPARIAHHAEAAGDLQSLARSARLACMSAVARTAHRDAVRHGERALSVQQHLSPDEVAELQMRLATSMIALARGGDAEALARRAVQHWSAAGDDRREAESLLVLSSSIMSLGRTEEAMVSLGRSVAILERHEPGRELTLAYVRLTSAHMLARERDPAVEWGERAIALATQHDDAVLLGMALAETGIADVMDGRFEGLARVRQAIALGRQHDLPAVVSNGYSQIGSGCGEMRRYEDAVPALIEGTAWAVRHSLEASRRYQTSWLARCRFDLGQWDEAEQLARDAIAGSRDVAIARFVGLNTLGWLRARRGDADVFALLDEALDIARSLSHLQRLWPNAVARAETGWLADDLEPHVPLLEEVIALAMRCRHGIAIGELGVWLHRAGRISMPPAGAAEPFASWISGDHMRATAGFRQMGCPYEAAAVLADAGDVASLREAFATFHRLGAVPMLGRVSTQLRAVGERVPSLTASKSPSARDPSGLTDRELEVLRLVCAGFTNPQIATSLYISRKTAEHHVSNILMKLGSTTRSEAAAVAVRRGLTG